MIIIFSEIISYANSCGVQTSEAYYICVKEGTQKLVYISLNRIKTGPRSCGACNNNLPSVK